MLSQTSSKAPDSPGSGQDEGWLSVTVAAGRIGDWVVDPWWRRPAPVVGGDRAGRGRS